MTHPTPVFFCPEMSAVTSGFSPSSGKPALAVADWQRHWDLEILKPTPATPRQFRLAHDPDYVDGVLAGRIDNGFGNRDPKVAAALPWTTGAMISAADWALRNAGVACAPTSGFHHAHHNQGGAFCTFNGLMVSALEMLEGGSADHAFILDCDYHYGDGTEDIIATTGAGARVTHFTSGFKFHRPDHAGAFFVWLKDCLQVIRGHPARRKLVLYQAGADAHIRDPLGGFLTTEELARRDREVLCGLRESRIPTVWNLAGGYQVEPDGGIPKVLEIHRNTMKVLVE